LCHSTSLLRLNIDRSPKQQSSELPSLSENSASLPMAWLRSLTSLQEWKLGPTNQQGRFWPFYQTQSYWVWLAPNSIPLKDFILFVIDPLWSAGQYASLL
jgi:hypothetical protein